jgi:hypothetical protein
VISLESVEAATTDVAWPGKIGDRVGSFVGGGVMVLTAGHLLVEECVGIKLSSFIGTLLGPEDVGDRVGSFVGGGAMGLTVGHSFLKECVDIKLGWFVGTLLRLEDVGNQAGSFVGGGVMGLTVCPPKAILSSES